MHRIDRETSGVLVVAKTPAAHFESSETPFGKVFLDKSMDAELLSEGFTREAVRHAQSLRKKLSLVEKDTVIVSIAADKDTLEMLQRDSFKKTVNARELTLGAKPAFAGENSEFEHDGSKVIVTVKK